MKTHTINTWTLKTRLTHRLIYSFIPDATSRDEELQGVAGALERHQSKRGGRGVKRLRRVRTTGGGKSRKKRRWWRRRRKRRRRR